MVIWFGDTIWWYDFVIWFADIWDKITMGGRWMRVRLTKPIMMDMITTLWKISPIWDAKTCNNNNNILHITYGWDYLYNPYEYLIGVYGQKSITVYGFDQFLTGIMTTGYDNPLLCVRILMDSIIPSILRSSMDYPLVMTNIAMENHHLQ